MECLHLIFFIGNYIKRNKYINLIFLYLTKRYQAFQFHNITATTPDYVKISFQQNNLSIEFWKIFKEKVTRVGRIKEGLVKGQILRM